MRSTLLPGGTKAAALRAAVPARDHAGHIALPRDRLGAAHQGTEGQPSIGPQAAGDTRGECGNPATARRIAAGESQDGPVNSVGSVP
jgi:hypothetical protein